MVHGPRQASAPPTIAANDRRRAWPPAFAAAGVGNHAGNRDIDRTLQAALTAPCRSAASAPRQSRPAATSNANHNRLVYRPRCRDDARKNVRTTKTTHVEEAHG
jgi:hypothetical protein